MNGMMQIKDRSLVGNSVCLVPVGEAVRFFPGYTRRAVFHVLHALHVPVLYSKKDALFNLFTLEEILYAVLRPGQPNLALPGSLFKRLQLDKKQTRSNIVPTTRTVVTDADMEVVNSEAVRLARLSTGLNALDSLKSLPPAGTRPKRVPRKKYDDDRPAQATIE